MPPNLMISARPTHSDGNKVSGAYPYFISLCGWPGLIAALCSFWSGVSNHATWRSLIAVLTSNTYCCSPCGIRVYSGGLSPNLDGDLQHPYFSLKVQIEFDTGVLHWQVGEHGQPTGVWSTREESWLSPGDELQEAAGMMWFLVSDLSLDWLRRRLALVWRSLREPLSTPPWGRGGWWDCVRLFGWGRCGARIAGADLWELRAKLKLTTDYCSRNRLLQKKVT